MLTLQTFGPAFGLPDPSPFVVKADMLMKLSGRAYKRQPSDVRKAPKGKLPVLIDGDDTVADSTFIRLHLEDKYGIDFDEGLDARQRGIAWSVEKMLEDSLYWAIMYERWMVPENFDKGPRAFFDVVPQPMRALLVPVIKRQVRRNLWGHGMGRHSRKDINTLAAKVLEAVSRVMGDNAYLMGARTCGADATVFAFVGGALCPLFEGEMLETARSFGNLVHYSERMTREFYPELA